MPAPTRAPTAMPDDAAAWRRRLVRGLLGVVVVSTAAKALRHWLAWDGSRDAGKAAIFGSAAFEWFRTHGASVFSVTLAVAGLLISLAHLGLRIVEDYHKGVFGPGGRPGERSEGSE